MNTYPTAQALTALIGGVAQAPDPGFLATSVAAGIDGFERECGRKMLAGKDTGNNPVAPSSRTFYGASVLRFPDGRMVLDLGPWGDLARVDSVVYESSAGAPETLVADTDYLAVPENAAQLSQPYSGIQLRRLIPSLSGAWRSVDRPRLVVTGLWGFSTVLPDDAWQAMLYAGGMTLYEGSWMQARAKILAGAAAGSALGLPLTSWTGPGGVSETSSTAIATELIRSALGAAGAAGAWAGTIAGAIWRYKRLEV